MIIQTGMRTDIPAFYSRWFCNRIRAGFVMVRNPFNPVQVTRYSLSPDVVDLIGFCTKNPRPMLTHMGLLKDYGQYWFVTITPYGKEIEPRVPAAEEVICDFKKLSDIVGPDSIGWRYDPIFLNDTYTPSRHLEEFSKIAEALAGYTKTCVISFIDLYSKVVRNFPEVRAVPRAEQIHLGQEMIRIAARYGMTVRPCGEDDELAPYGADCRGCLTQEVFEQALHCRLHMPAFQKSRKECACYLSCDIGAYNTCPHQCRYCYANYDTQTVRENIRQHDPDSPFLIGGSRPEDIVHQSIQKSWKDPQMSIFDYLK